MCCVVRGSFCGCVTDGWHPSQGSFSIKNLFSSCLVVCPCSPWEWTGWRCTQRMWTRGRSSWTCRSGESPCWTCSHSRLAVSQAFNEFHCLFFDCQLFQTASACYFQSPTKCLHSMQMTAVKTFCSHISSTNFDICSPLFISVGGDISHVWPASVQCLRLGRWSLCVLLSNYISLLLRPASSVTQRLTWTSRSTTAELGLRAYRCVCNDSIICLDLQQNYVAPGTHRKMSVRLIT